MTGLQQLIDTAVSYVTDHGLRFSPDKTKCLLFGANPFDSIPNWKMNNTSLSVESNLTYLGAEIGSNSGKIHIEKRIRCAQRAFYSLQGSGLKFRGVLPETAMSIFKTVIHSTLSYGCTAIYLNKKCIYEMDKLQGKLIKTVLGLSKFCYTTPLLKALRVKPISQVINMFSLNLFRSCIMSNSSTSSFYSYLYHVRNRKYVGKTLIGRVMEFC